MSDLCVYCFKQHGWLCFAGKLTKKVDRAAIQAYGKCWRILNVQFKDFLVNESVYYTLLSVKCIQIYEHSTMGGCADVRRLVTLRNSYRMEERYMRCYSVAAVVVGYSY